DVAPGAVRRGEPHAPGRGEARARGVGNAGAHGGDRVAEHVHGHEHSLRSTDRDDRTGSRDSAAWSVSYERNSVGRMTTHARTVLFDELGGPDVLRIEELPLGAPGPGEVRVRVEAIGLN